MADKNNTSTTPTPVEAGGSGASSMAQGVRSQAAKVFRDYNEGGSGAYQRYNNLKQVHAQSNADWYESPQAELRTTAVEHERAEKARQEENARAVKAKYTRRRAEWDWERTHPYRYYAFNEDFDKQFQDEWVRADAAGQPGGRAEKREKILAGAIEDALHHADRAGNIFHSEHWNRTYLDDLSAPWRDEVREVTAQKFTDDQLAFTLTYIYTPEQRRQALTNAELYQRNTKAVNSTIYPQMDELQEVIRKGINTDDLRLHFHSTVTKANKNFAKGSEGRGEIAKLAGDGHGTHGGGIYWHVSDKIQKAMRRYTALYKSIPGLQMKDLTEPIPLTGDQKYKQYWAKGGVMTRDQWKSGLENGMIEQQNIYAKRVGVSAFKWATMDFVYMANQLANGFTGGQSDGPGSSWKGEADHYNLKQFAMESAMFLGTAAAMETKPMKFAMDVAAKGAMRGASSAVRATAKSAAGRTISAGAGKTMSLGRSMARKFRMSTGGGSYFKGAEEGAWNPSFGSFAAREDVHTTASLKAEGEWMTSGVNQADDVLRDDGLFGVELMERSSMPPGEADNAITQFKKEVAQHFQKKPIKSKSWIEFQPRKAPLKPANQVESGAIDLSEHTMLPKTLAEPWEFTNASYIEPDLRTDIGKFKYLREQSDEEMGIWVNPDTKTVHISHRGSVTARDWLNTDVLIGAGMEALSTRVVKAEAKYTKMLELFPEYNFNSSGHSLGGGVVTQMAAKFGGNPRFGASWTFNGASSPLGLLTKYVSAAGGGFEGRLNKILTHVKMSNDLVSFSPNPYGKVVTFKNPGVNPAAAHKMGAFKPKGEFGKDFYYVHRKYNGIEKIQEKLADKLKQSAKASASELEREEVGEHYDKQGISLNQLVRSGDRYSRGPQNRFNRGTIHGFTPQHRPTHVPRARTMLN